MAYRNSITFDGINSLEYGVYVSGSGAFDAPARDIEMITVPGRNGSLAMDRGRYENIEVTYPAGLWELPNKSFEEALAAFRAELVSRYSYVVLSDTYNPDEFRLALYRSGLDVDPRVYNRAGEFSIVFDCKPQRFLTSGATAVSLARGQHTLNNPTLFPAAPLIEVTGTGSFIFGGVEVEISGSNHTVIDCDLMEAYDGTTSKNGNIVLTPNEFPKLQPGDNLITVGSGFSEFLITPRWWRL